MEERSLPGMGGVYNTINAHLYHYAGNNPVKYTDPDGETPVIPLIIIVATAMLITSDKANSNSANNTTATEPQKFDNHPEGRTLNGNNQAYLETQQSLVGTNYMWKGNDPAIDGGVDCSGGPLYGLNSLGNDLPDQNANSIYNNYTNPVKGAPQPGNVRFLFNGTTASHMQTISGQDRTRINPTGDEQNTRENPGIIEEIPGPLPSSGEVRAFRWNQDYQN